MLSKRVIAVSAEKTFQKKLAAGLMAAGGAVEIVSSADELAREPDADLIVYHVTEFPDKKLTSLLGRLRKDAKVISIVPTSDLDKMVTLMKDERLSNCLVAEDLETTMLSGVATRLLYGDVFGLEKFMPWGVRIYSMLVGDYQEKSVAIAAVSDFAAAMGVRRKYRESIEQCIDELLMNALYDAPTDTEGKQMFAEVPTKTRISLRMEQKAVIQYACDGNQFAVSVRDSFGALKKDIVVKYIDKCLHAGEQQIDRKAGGAGLGLYIIANSTSQFVVNLYPGVATECVCTFALDAPKVQLKNFGVFHERIDASGRLVTSGGSKLVQAGRSAASAPREVTVSSTGLRVALAASLLLVIGLAGVVLYPILLKKKGSIAITTDPPGASIDVDQKPRGQASPSLTVADLESGPHHVVAHHPGYGDKDVYVEVSGGHSTPLQLSLPRSTATVGFRSVPPGAKLLIDGKERGQTPLEVADLPPGSKHKVTFQLFGYVEETQDLEVKGAGSESQVQSSLRVSADFGSLQIESDPPGATVLVNDDVQVPGLTPVDEYLLKAGQDYVLTVKLAGYMPQKLPVTLRAGERRVVKAKLAPGGALTVDANVQQATVSVDGEVVGKLPLKDYALAEGSHTVEVKGYHPWVSESFDVEIKRGDEVKKTLELGFVDVTIPDATAVPKGKRGQGAARLALHEGTYTVVVFMKGGEKKEKVIRVRAGASEKIDKL
jgi:hypothetical protein